MTVEQAEYFEQFRASYDTITNDYLRFIREAHPNDEAYFLVMIEEGEYVVRKMNGLMSQLDSIMKERV